MPTDIKTLSAEIAAEATDAKTAIAALQTENAALKAQVGNVSDEDTAAIRHVLADLKASYTSAAPAPAPAPATN